jgi:hypothetical protein
LKQQHPGQIQVTYREFGINLTNTAGGAASTVGGGVGNTASGYFSTVPGGVSNTAAGAYSFAAGNRAKANHTGSIVLADSTNADFASTAADQFLIRASGGVGIGTNSPLADTALDVAGMIRSSTGGYKFPDGSVQTTASTCSEPRTPISSLPYTISQSGSYYLTSSLSGTSGQDGISISASNVTLDLMGFTVQGVPGSLYGIINSGVTNNITIRNGNISGWGGEGIVLTGSGIHRTIQDILSSANGGDGIVGGDGCEVLKCGA